MVGLIKLFVRELSDIYDAEHQLLHFLPKLAEASFSDELREAFLFHTEETENHVQRLEHVFKLTGHEINRRRSPSMEKLISDGLAIIKNKERSPITDAALVAVVQKIEHLEIASYGCLCLWTQMIQRNDLLDVLQSTIEEEEEADRRLTDIVEQTVDEESDIPLMNEEDLVLIN